MSQNTKIALIIGGVVLVLLIGVPFLWGGTSGWQGGGGGMMGPGMMGGSGWGLFGPILMLLFWGLVIWGVVALARGVGGPGPGPTPHDSALELLKRRYARGEVSKEEYEGKKRDLVE